MELWIRNQEKDILIKVDNLELDDERNDIYTHNCIDNMQMTYTLGRYKSKERALEVLDEIQNIISGKTILKSFDNVTSNFNDKVIIKPCEVKIEQLNTYVYQMPQE